MPKIMVMLEQIPLERKVFRRCIVKRIRLSEYEKNLSNLYRSDGKSIADSPNAHLAVYLSSETQRHYLVVTDHYQRIAHPDAAIDIASIVCIERHEVVSLGLHHSRVKVTFHASDILRTKEGKNLVERFTVLLKEEDGDDFVRVIQSSQTAS